MSKTEILHFSSDPHVAECNSKEIIRQLSWRIIRPGTSFFLAGTISVIHILAQSPKQASAQLRAPVHVVEDEYFGQRIFDPYRWMEDKNNPELLDWMKAQTDYTHRYLNNLSSRPKFLDRIRLVRGEQIRIGRVRKQGQRLVYLKENLGSRIDELCFRDGLGGTEKTLAKAGGAERMTIDEFDVSPNGRYVAYTSSAAGREVGKLQIVEVSSGLVLPDVIPETSSIEPFYPVINSFSGTWWSPDSRSFVYRKLGPDAAIERSRIMLHTLGTSPSKDRRLLGDEFNVNGLGKPDMSYVWFAKNAPYAIAELGASVNPRKEFFVADVSRLHDQMPRWRRLNRLEDEIRDVSNHGDSIFLRSSRNAPKFEILGVRASDTVSASTKAVFPPGQSVIEASAAAKDGLYVQTLAGGERKIYRLQYDSWSPRPIPIPANTSARLVANDPAEPGVLLALESWTEPTLIASWNPMEEKLTKTHWLPPASVRMPDTKVERLNVPSHDGVLIPLVILSPANRSRGETARTIMFGYGASGVELTAPHFTPGTIPWLESGGIQAYVGTRGGGEYGAEWQKAGAGPTKPNTWKDFIACTEYLIKNGYATPRQLGIVAASAGGLLAGNALAERPDLFAAVAISAGDTNPLRLSFTESHEEHVEFGRIGTESEFKATLAMDPYHKIRDGTRYPAVLLIHGINDPRLATYFSAKFAARLQAATTSGKPVLLEVDYGAGHNTISPEISADQMSFFWANLASARDPR